jgi:hypothetical protein
MDADNTYHSYTGADILRYLEGRMTNKEMRQLELAAINDPFLEDAIDGYKETYAKSGKEPIINALNGTLAAKSAPKHLQTNKNLTSANNNSEPKTAAIIPFWKRKSFQMAVAATLIIGTGWYVFNVTNSHSSFESKKTEIAALKNTDTIKAADNAADLVTANVSQPTLAPATKSVAPKDDRLAVATRKKEVRTAPFVAPPMPATTSSGKVEAESTVNSEEQADTVPVLVATVAEHQAKQKEFNNTVGSVIIPASKSKSRVYDSQHLEDTKPQKIRGMVVDGAKFPLDNITLRIKGSPASTISDELGRFEMVLPDTNATVIASGPGYKTKEFKSANFFYNNQKLEFQLEQDRNLEEELVMGYLKKKNVTANAKPVAFGIDSSEATPIGGWNNYVNYIKENKRFKDRQGSLAIVVVLNFEVDKNGIPSEFEIMQSGGNTYNKEAIRLLKEGPLWKIKNAEEETAAVKITLVL